LLLQCATVCRRRFDGGSVDGGYAHREEEIPAVTVCLLTMGAVMTSATTTGEEGKGDDDVRQEQKREEESTDEPTTTTSGEKEEEDEDEEECGFCKYMKGGSCKDAFVAWEACVDEAKEKEEDFVERCFETTSALRDCMLKDPEYYGPMVGENEGNDGEDGDGEKAKEEEAVEA
jgi:intermembrane space import and assembly protein 40